MYYPGLFLRLRNRLLVAEQPHHSLSMWLLSPGALSAEHAAMLGMPSSVHAAANPVPVTCPATTIIILLLVWLFIGFPLTVLGGIVGRKNAGVCTVRHIMHANDHTTPHHTTFLTLNRDL